MWNWYLFHPPKHTTPKDESNIPQNIHVCEQKAIAIILLTEVIQHVTDGLLAKHVNSLRQVAWGVGWGGVGGQ